MAKKQAPEASPQWIVPQTDESGKSECERLSEELIALRKEVHVMRDDVIKLKRTTGVR